MTHFILPCSKYSKVDDDVSNTWWLHSIPFFLRETSPCQTCLASFFYPLCQRCEISTRHEAAKVFYIRECIPKWIFGKASLVSDRDGKSYSFPFLFALSKFFKVFLAFFSFLRSERKGRGEHKSLVIVSKAKGGLRPRFRISPIFGKLLDVVRKTRKRIERSLGCKKKGEGEGKETSFHSFTSAVAAAVAEDQTVFPSLERGNFFRETRSLSSDNFGGGKTRDE